MSSAKMKETSIAATPTKGSKVVVDETVSFLWRNYRIVLKEVTAQRDSGVTAASFSGRPFHCHREEKSFRLQLEQHKVRATEGRHRLWY
jgi:hypothetical protein